MGHAVYDLRAVAVDQFRMIGKSQRPFKEGRHGEPVGNAADEGRLDDEKQQLSQQAHFVAVPPPEYEDKAEER